MPKTEKTLMLLKPDAIARGFCGRILDRFEQAGFRIIPVNPTLVGSKLFGERVRATLGDIDEPVDMVDVFRRSEHTPPIARDAVAIGSKALWLQQGIVSEESRKIAEEAGIDYVEDRCMAVERARFQIEKEPT